MRKNLSILLLILILGGGLYVFGIRKVGPPIGVKNEEGVLGVVEERNEIYSTLSVTNADGTEMEYGNFTLEQGSSAFDLLIKAAKESTFSFEYSESEFGIFITSINGYEPDINSEYWKFLVNGEVAQVGVSDYILKDGDWVRFELEKIK